jgi:hypothetical protein
LMQRKGLQEKKRKNVMLEAVEIWK